MAKIERYVDFVKKTYWELWTLLGALVGIALIVLVLFVFPVWLISRFL